MTLLDIKNHLYAHFLGQSTFSLNTDLPKVQLGASYDDPGAPLADTKKIMFTAALVDMEKAGYLLVVKPGIYMLTQPIMSFVQTITVSPYVASLLADVFNIFARDTDQSYRSNKMAITDAEIGALAQICLGLKSELDTLLSDSEEDDEES